MTLIETLTSENLLITLGAILPSLLLAMAVWLRANHRRDRVLFVLSAFLTSLWSIANLFSLQSLNVLFWVRLVLFSALILVTTFYLFIRSFSGKSLANWKMIPLLFLVASAAILSQTRFVFSTIKYVLGEPVPVVGPLIGIFGFTILLLFFLSSFELIRGFARNHGVKRAQFAYIGAGYFLMFFMLILTQFIFATVFQNTSFVKYAPLFTLPFFAASSFAIYKLHLFNLKVIASETFAALIVAFFLIDTVNSGSVQEFIMNLLVLLSVSLFAVLLIRGVLRKVKQKEILDELAKQLAASNEQLKRLDEAKTEFLSIASHQLRSPMTGIKGYLSMLVEGDFGRINSEQKRVMSNIMVNTESLIQLVNLFLDVTRIEEGRFELVPVKTDLVKMAEQTVEQLNPQAQTKQLKLALQTPAESLPDVYIDPQKIKQVFVNLIDNAIKYTPHGLVTISLTLENNPPKFDAALHQKIDLGKIRGKRIVICISDTGIGLNQSDIDQLFQKFFRVKGTAQVFTGGSGLGLFVVKKIVELHGGDLAVSSPGKKMGSTFCFSLGVDSKGLITTGKLVSPATQTK